MTPAIFLVDTEAKRDRVAARVKALPLEGVRWEIAVKPWEPKRSEDANRRLWLLHGLAAQHTGHSSEEMHEAMCLRFLPRREIVVLGEKIEVRGQSSKLTVKAFREFMDAVEAFYISELGIVLGDR